MISLLHAQSSHIYDHCELKTHQLFAHNIDKSTCFAVLLSKKFATKSLLQFLYCPLYVSLHYTLRNLNISLLSFIDYSCYKNLHPNFCNSYYVTRITVTCFWLNSNCLSCARSIVSSLSSRRQCSCSLSTRDSHLQKWETPAFISSNVWLQ